MRLLIILLPVLVLGYLWYMRNRVQEEARAMQDSPDTLPAGGETFPLPPIRSAREVLDRRYAEGEISREDYLRIRDDIDQGGEGEDKV